MTKELMMDRAKKKLNKLHSVIEWLLEHWDHLPGDLYELVVDDSGQASLAPRDVKKFLVDLARQDFANAITPTVAWQDIAKAEGVDLPTVEERVDAK